jgi:site-specific DNA-methyltransferase (cytosine-N4-specific)
MERRLIGKLELNKIYNYDCLEGLKLLPDRSVNLIVTSPPYWAQRDYGVEGQLGLEPTPELYIDNLVSVFSECFRVLADDGVMYINIGDSYFNSTFIREKSSDGWANKGDGDSYDKYYASNGGGVAGGKRRSIKHPVLKVKELVGIPWKLAFALQEVGWYLRSDIIWSKPNPMPEPVRDRPSKSHEYIFMFTKKKKYYYNKDASQDTPNDGKRTVWNVNTDKFKGAHFATFPKELILPCILNACPEGGIVLDPFLGSGTTALVAIENNRNYIGFELNPEYIRIAEQRLNHAERG